MITSLHSNVVTLLVHNSLRPNDAYMRQWDSKPLSDPMINQFADSYMRHDIGEISVREAYLWQGISPWCVVRFPVKCDTTLTPISVSIPITYTRALASDTLTELS